MALHRYERFAYRVLGRRAAQGVERNPRLRHSLQRAHIYRRPDVYLASAMMTSLIVTMATALPVLVLVVAGLLGFVEVPLRVLVFILPVPGLAGAVLYLLSLVMPELRAISRS